MNTAKNIYFWIAFSFVLSVASNAQADTVGFTLDNVIMERGNAQMTGKFSWTYTPGEFADGVGKIIFLDIPFTSHDHTDTNVTFDIEGSIEITLAGNYDNDGVDITLFLDKDEPPLTATTPVLIDTDRSKYELGGNGFITGPFLSGSIAPATPGDTDGDHDVDITDYRKFLSQFGGAPGPGTADFNYDNVVNLDDFSILRGNFGFGVTPISTTAFDVHTPEPTSLLFLAAGALAILRKRRS
jgi:hypothetical protein